MKKYAPIAGFMVLTFVAGCKMQKPSTLSREDEAKIIAPDQFQPSQRQKRESISEVAYQIQTRKQNILDNPKDDRSHLILASYQKRLGNDKEAISHYEHANLIKSLPEQEELALAQLYAKNGKLDQALTIYTKYQKKYPNNWRLRNDIANVYRKQKNYASALSIVEGLLKEKNDNVFAMHTLSLIYMDQKKYDLAELTLQRARKLNPKNAETWNQLGLTYQKRDMRDEAHKSFLAATERNPQLLEPKMNLAQTYISHHDYSNASKLYLDILNIDPLNLTAIYHLGIAHAALGQDEEAEKAFLNILKLDPTNRDIMYPLGLFYQYNMQDGQKAVRYYQRFISLNAGLPKNHEVYRNMQFAEKMPPKAAPVTQEAPKKQDDKEKK